MTILEEIFSAALRAVEPKKLIQKQVQGIRLLYERGGFSRLWVVGFGKASPGMAAALEEEMPQFVTGGVVITKYGHARTLERIELREAGHPLPDENGLGATEELLSIISKADERTLVVCLVSGGGSALLVKPLKGVTLPEKQRVTELLLRSGAGIDELNTVRKHLSAVKGGRLAAAAHPARIESLIISDVPGDRLDVIASGPTAPDPTTYRDALLVLQERGVVKAVPQGVLRRLSEGEGGLLPETPKKDSTIFSTVRNIILGSNRLALSAARSKAEALGLKVEVLTSELRGEAREAGRWLAGKALGAKGRGETGLCFLSGGETTVTVQGTGRGGRNMELALSFAISVEGREGLRILSAGTDGTDGDTDAAGAVADGSTAGRARALGIDPAAYLENNDSYTFFQKTGGLFTTGPTGTNVMDMEVIIVSS